MRSPGYRDGWWQRQTALCGSIRLQSSLVYSYSEPHRAVHAGLHFARQLSAHRVFCTRTLYWWERVGNLVTYCRSPCHRRTPSRGLFGNAARARMPRRREIKRNPAPSAGERSAPQLAGTAREALRRPGKQAARPKSICLICCRSAPMTQISYGRSPDVIVDSPPSERCCFGAADSGVIGSGRC